MNHSFFVSGIGTDVGKTIVSAVLCELLYANYWKPVQSGELENTDSMKVNRLVSFENFNFYPEQFRLTQPLSPHVSAKLDGIEINESDFNIPKNNGRLIIEGAGGLMVPVNEKGLLYCDLAAEWKLPTILVSRHYLGSINHTLMSIETLQNRSIPILGIIYVGDELPMTEEIIFTKTKIPTLLHVPIFETLTKETIANFAAQLRTPETLAKFGL
jgi:dethiobiotin synthetase